MFGYLSLDIICSSKLTVFLELRSRKTVRLSERIMSKDKYPSIFSKLTVFLELRSRKTVRFSEQIMSADKYSRILIIFRAKWRLLLMYRPMISTNHASSNYPEVIKAATQWINNYLSKPIELITHGHWFILWKVLSTFWTTRPSPVGHSIYAVVLCQNLSTDFHPVVQC